MQRAFRLRAKHLFLTYPRCPMPPQEALALFRAKPGIDIDRYLICVEDHADGTPHLHVYLGLKGPIDTTNQNFFDLQGEALYHGNYQAARSAANVIRYVKKDGVFITNLKDGALPKEGRAELAKKLMNTGLESFILEYPQFIFGYKKLKLDYIEYQNDQYKPTIREVSAHWYYGATRLGKSWKALTDQAGLMLEYHPETRVPKLTGDFSKIYFKNSQNKWFDGYSGQTIVFIDELPIEAAPWILNYLKQWTDRVPLQPEIKGSRLWARWDRVVVTCQHSPREFFAGSHSADVEALLARFTTHNITIKQY